MERYKCVECIMSDVVSFKRAKRLFGQINAIIHYKDIAITQIY